LTDHANRAGRGIPNHFPPWEITPIKYKDERDEISSLVGITSLIAELELAIDSRGVDPLVHDNKIHILLFKSLNNY
jgi:hypothetical protein